MNTIVPLSRRYEAHGTAFDSVELRVPTLADYFEVGDPVELQPAGGGGAIVVEHLDRIKDYRDRLVVKPDLTQIVVLDLEDAMAVKDAITDFFGEARKRLRRRTSSSGAAGGA